MSDADDKRGKMVPELVSTLDLINKIHKLKCDVFSLKEQMVQQGVELHNTKVMLKMHEECLEQRNAQLWKSAAILDVLTFQEVPNGIKKLIERAERAEAALVTACYQIAWHMDRERGDKEFVRDYARQLLWHVAKPEEAERTAGKLKLLNDPDPKPSKFSDPNACPECGSDDWIKVLPPICACCGYGKVE